MFCFVLSFLFIQTKKINVCIHTYNMWYEYILKITVEKKIIYKLKPSNKYYILVFTHRYTYVCLSHILNI